MAVVIHFLHAIRPEAIPAQAVMRQAARFASRDVHIVTENADLGRSLRAKELPVSLLAEFPGLGKAGEIAAFDKARALVLSWRRAGTPAVCVALDLIGGALDETLARLIFLEDIAHEAERRGISHLFVAGLSLPAGWAALRIGWPLVRHSLVTRGRCLPLPRTLAARVLSAAYAARHQTARLQTALAGRSDEASLTARFIRFCHQSQPEVLFFPGPLGTLEREVMELVVAALHNQGVRTGAVTLDDRVSEACRAMGVPWIELPLDAACFNAEPWAGTEPLPGPGLPARALWSSLAAPGPLSGLLAANRAVRRLFSQGLAACTCRSLVSFHHMTAYAAGARQAARDLAIPWNWVPVRGGMVSHARSMPLLDDWTTVCAHGTQMAEALRGAGVSPERLHLTGNCLLDRLTDKTTPEARQRFLNNFPQLRGKRLVLVATSGQPPEEQHWLTHLATSWRTRKDTVFLLKPHPDMGDKRYMHFGLHLSDNFLILKSCTPIDDILPHVDVLVTDWSYTGFEASLLRLPIVTINLTGHPFAFSFANHSVALEACNLEEIDCCLDQALHGSEAFQTMHKARERFNETIHYAWKDGRSVERIVRVLTGRSYS